MAAQDITLGVTYLIHRGDRDGVTCGKPMGIMKRRSISAALDIGASVGSGTNPYIGISKTVT
jgi:hypothetical protein